MPCGRSFGVSLLAVLLAGPLLTSSSPRAAGPGAQDQPPQPTFRTEANYVRVDVYPTLDQMPVTDLTLDEFEVFDNGTLQKIEQFERVVIRAAGPQDTRVEPNTVRESRSMLESSRSRVFVLFLDTYHVDLGGSHNIEAPLIAALDKVIGADDLVGVMTPQMAASDIAFARKTTTIEGFLTRYWYWGERDRVGAVDRRDREYEACYGPGPIATEMIQRRHEKVTMDALQDLVVFLRGVREERKAVLAISDGWLLFRPNPVLANKARPEGPLIGVDPQSGRITTGKGSDCDGDRIQLAQLDDESQFRRMLDEANRANTSFYPIDPRGLAVFDTPIGPNPPPSIVVDQQMLRARTTSLRTLADATDGLAIVGTNNLAGGLRRVVDDLTSYYLLGYYASGKLDGRFHAITVRVKRRGVNVRARRGYLSATEADANAARAAASTPAALSPAAAAAARALGTALSPLDGYARPLPIRTHAAAGWKPGNTAAVWVVGELDPGRPEWRGGVDVELSLLNAAGATIATASARVEAGSRGFRALFAPDQPLAPDDYRVRVRLKTTDVAASASDTLRITLRDAPAATGAIYVRHGPSTINRDLATSDLRFRRSEQLRLEVPAPSNAAFTARLLDRTGQPLAIPVTAIVRDDADGSRWQVAHLTLAPLAPADYVIEIAGPDGERSLFGFRVIP